MACTALVDDRPAIQVLIIISEVAQTDIVFVDLAVTVVVAGVTDLRRGLAVGANVMAFLNRLTSLHVSNALAGRYVYAIVVSGYSGGDIVAKQLLGALCLNKSLLLPPGFCMMETANDPGEAAALPGIQTRLAAFAQTIRTQTLLPAP